MNLFETARMKLERAAEHLDGVDASIGEHDFGRFERRVNKVDDSISAIYRENRGLDPRWGLGIGDAVHNMRSSLDYSIGDAARAKGGKGTRYHFFPITVDEAAWKQAHDPANRFSDWHPPLEGTSCAVRDYVRDAQPYVGRNRNDAEQTALTVVHRMDNTDKHRALHTAALYVSANPSEIRITDARGEIVAAETLWQAQAGLNLIDGTEVLRYKIPPTDGSERPDMYVESALSTEIVFQGSQDLSVSIERFREIIPEFSSIIAAIEERAVD